MTYLINEIIPLHDFYLQNRRTIELIMRLDEKVEKFQIQLKFLRKEYLENLMRGDMNFNRRKKLEEDINKLTKRISTISETKIHLVDKLSEISDDFITIISKNLEKNSNYNDDQTVNYRHDNSMTTMSICKCNGKIKHINMNTLQTNAEKMRMIKCENKNCKILWFHLKCLGLKSFPNDIWFCTNECYESFYYSSINYDK